MGLFDFILRKSSKVGGTTRWVAATYKSIQKANPGLTHLQVLQHVNAARCSGYRDQYIIDTLNNWMQNAENKTLYDYVYHLIQVESEHSQLPKEVGPIIANELSSAGLDDKVVWGH